MTARSASKGMAARCASKGPRAIASHPPQFSAAMHQTLFYG